MGSHSIETIASEWLRLFISDLTSSNLHGILSLEHSFMDDSYWRDLLAFTPDYRTLYTRHHIQQCLSGGVAIVRPTHFRIMQDVRVRHAGNKSLVQGIVQFRTVIAECTGIFTLVQTGGGVWKAWSFVTVMDRLRGVTERHKIGNLSLNRPFERRDVMEYGVVVLGAGQCGLAVAARFENIGIPTLVVEKSTAVGDTWRSRYKTLETNTPRAFNALPFLPFPESLGEYISCVGVADHLDDYHKALGLHLLTSAHATTSYDTLTKKWKILILQPDQPPIIVISSHLVVATGVGTLKGQVPFVPSIPGKASFLGICMHTSEYSHSCIAEGQNAIVIGAGCSGHDIAQDLATKGSKVTLVQRSPTAIVSREAMGRSFRGTLLIYHPHAIDLVTGYFEPDILPIDTADRLYISLPYKALQSFQHEITSTNSNIDKELRDSLTNCGYLLPGPNDNFLDRLVIRRGGYYIDRGCVKLITSGKIVVMAGIDISHMCPSGLVFADGTRVTADLIVFATGFNSTTIKDVAQNLLGPKIAESVNDLGAWDQDWEFAGIWRPSGHQGLWFAEGDLFTARFYSQLLALQIKAREMGLVTPHGDSYHSFPSVAQIQ
ncbi:putative dimethylaniline monooxygenase (N-oxide-forming) [Boletus coccyginus]|nr:putative dimethylaniline monooxygenase (N-oxide-forming) [Boletus coccyginus]